MEMASYVDTKVVGVTFGGRQSVIRQMQAGEPLILRREHDNAYDRNAIRVERANGVQVGYISKELAAELAKQIDSVGGAISAKAQRIVGEEALGHNLGVRIAFSVPN
jgi:single-stranded-DNA-specific exonuclease